MAGPAGVYLIDAKVRRYPRGLAAERHLARATLSIAARVSRRLGVEVDSVWAIFGRCSAHWGSTLLAMVGGSPVA